MPLLGLCLAAVRRSPGLHGLWAPHQPLGVGLVLRQMGSGLSGEPALPLPRLCLFYQSVAGFGPWDCQPLSYAVTWQEGTT